MKKKDAWTPVIVRNPTSEMLAKAKKRKSAKPVLGKIDRAVVIVVSALHNESPKVRIEVLARTLGTLCGLDHLDVEKAISTVRLCYKTVMKFRN